MRDDTALYAALCDESAQRKIIPPTLKAVKRLGTYSSLCGTWWDENRTHLPSPEALPPIHTPPWRACGSVAGREVAAGETPTCGGCRQIMRMRGERSRPR